jgi:hypothetical protein
MAAGTTHDGLVGRPIVELKAARWCPSTARLALSPGTISKTAAEELGGGVGCEREGGGEQDKNGNGDTGHCWYSETSGETGQLGEVSEILKAGFGSVNYAKLSKRWNSLDYQRTPDERRPLPSLENPMATAAIRRTFRGPRGVETISAVKDARKNPERVPSGR